ncbi:flagellar motor switch protein FliG [Neobacillus sp. NPDC058068]|uniref:flagellar motor switch protein FliG n=1 Tax=Neobacillus sp. NPDC058068 TaxID=3346325 RepID=UPI0036DB4FED
MEIYTNIQKAAILLLSLGPDVTVQVLKHMEEKEIESITTEISNLRKVPPDVTEKILKEFHDLVVASRVVSYGGADVAKELLLRTFGEEKAASFMNRIDEFKRPDERPFEFLAEVEPKRIVQLLQTENAQTIALVLSYLNSDQAAAVLSLISPERQFEISKRIALMGFTSPEIVRQVEQAFIEKLSLAENNDSNGQNGIDSIVNILSSVNRGTEKNILETFADKDPELANEIKQRMFVFEDLSLLDNRSIQRILMDVANQDLPLALRSASEAVKNAIFANISKRRLETLEEELAANEPVRQKEMEEAQSRIVSIVRKLEYEGVIIISRNQPTQEQVEEIMEEEEDLVI